MVEYSSELWQKGPESISSGSVEIQRILKIAVGTGKGCIIGRQGTFGELNRICD